MYCFGKETRRNMIQRYDIKAIAHVKLLQNQKKHSCTGRVLTDSYYCFEFKAKKDTKDSGAFFCGESTGKHFIKLTGSENLPLFNPLKVESVGNCGVMNNSRSTSESHDPVTKQLINAINLLVVCWDTAPYGKLAKIKQDRTKYFSRSPFDNEIEYVNVVIGYDKKERILVQMLEELKVNNNNLKSYKFDLLNNLLAKKTSSQTSANKVLH